ncbi:MAG: hypothetical protein Q9162_006219 [Coniocarpon cinnabarinum]
MSDGHNETATKNAVSSHRLPTLSASQALQQTSTSTGAPNPKFRLRSLDQLISGDSPIDAEGDNGGVQRGRVCEIYGPPGAGKTALCMSAATSVLRRDDSVIWIAVDCRNTLPIPRLQSFLSSDEAPTSLEATAETSSISLDQLTKFHHYTTPTLAHFIALILHPPSTFPPPNTALLVVDFLGTLIDSSYPRSARRKDTKPSSDRRRNVIGDIARGLTRLAALKNLSVIVTNHVVTQIRAVPLSALLKPAISTSEWESALHSRIVLFRDWARGSVDDESHESQRQRPHPARFARVLRANGTNLSLQRTDTLVPFDITETGLKELTDCGIATRYPEEETAARVPSKRRREEMERDSGRDSERDAERGSDDEYGFVEEEMNVAAEGLVDERFLTARDVTVTQRQQRQQTPVSSGQTTTREHIETSDEA